MTAATDKGSTVKISKSFTFDRGALDSEGKPKKKVINFDINGEMFVLMDDLQGFELLHYVSIAGTTAGVADLFRRTIKDEDWERFKEAVKGAVPADFGKMAGRVLDAYSGIPTTPEDDS